MEEASPASSITPLGDKMEPEEPTQIAAPRVPSPSTAARLRVKNRRKRYLDTHPDYYSSSSLELADPLAYDRLIRRFQTPKEREEEGRRKGYSGVLEADLWRSEAKMEALQNTEATSLITYRRGSNGEILEEEKDEAPQTKEDGMRRWRKGMDLRFLRGDDEDFEYEVVDDNEEYDDRGVEEREEEEKWFEEEEPRWVSGMGGSEVINVVVEGETGIQDF